MSSATTVARLVCDEPTARQLAEDLAEKLDADSTVCAAFSDNAHWRLEIYFRNAPDEPAIRALIAATADRAAAAALSFERVAARDWVAASLANLKPVDAGRFTVHGAHDRDRVAAHRIGVEIEAALAFGTGHHGTTRGCLLALDRLAKRLRARNVLDIGTGTGVLAIAAAQFFRSPVTAVDIDARAVAIARGNARLNGAVGSISFACTSGARSRFVRVRGPYDLIFANILLAPLARMAADIERVAAPGATIVLSGLMPRDENAAGSVFAAHGFVRDGRIALENWMTLVLRKPARSQLGQAVL
jgi:ribosomal protein L11 methyltransferase